MYFPDSDELESFHEKVRSLDDQLAKFNGAEVTSTSVVAELSSISKQWLKMSTALGETGICDLDTLQKIDDATKDILNSGSALGSTVGIVDIKTGAQIGIYPNPSEGFAVVGINVQKETKVSLNIYDITGKVVYNNESPALSIGQNEISINTSNFAPGLYTVVVTTNNGVLRDKLIVN